MIVFSFDGLKGLLRIIERRDRLTKVPIVRLASFSVSLFQT